MFSVHHSSVESVARGHLQKTMDGFTQTLTRLSTGKRINSPKDDPSGFIAVQLIRSNTAKAQGTLKSNQALGSMLAVVDSGLSNVTALLNQAKGLIVAGANTGALSQDQIDAYQAQLDATLDSIQRIANTTTFQGNKVLEGLNSLLNGTMSDEQKEQMLGVSKNSNATSLLKESIDSNKQIESKSTNSDEITLGEFADELLSALKLAAKLQEKVEGTISEDVTGMDDNALEFLQEIQIEQAQADVHTAIDSWVQDRFGADADESVRLTLVNDLFEQMLNVIANGQSNDAESAEGDISKKSENAILSISAEDLINLVSENLESIFADGEEISLEQATEKLENVKREAAEHEEQKRLEAQALAEKEQLAAEKAEEERREKEEAEKLAALQEHADKMYFMTRKVTPQVELVQDRVEEKSTRQEQLEQIHALFSGDNIQKNFEDAGLSQLFYVFKNSIADFSNSNASEQEKGEQLFQALQAAVLKDALKDATAGGKKTTIAEMSGEAGEVLVQDTSADQNFTVSDETEVYARTIEDLKTGGIASLRNNPEAADRCINGLISSANLMRTLNAIEQKSLDVQNESLTNEMFHLQELESQISDADFAEEMSNLARYQILMHTGTRALQVAHDVTKIAISFLDNATSSSLLTPGKSEKLG